jgi:hypothetical protein
LTNGGNIFISTNGILIVSNVTCANAGSYSVTVSNGNGTLTSAAATLTVLPRVPGLNILNATEGNSFYDRNEVLATTTSGLSWVEHSGASYSFGLAGFPTNAPYGPEAYMFLVPNAAAEDNAPDWNEAACMILEIQSTTNGGGQAILLYKIDQPNAEPTNSVSFTSYTGGPNPPTTAGTNVPTSQLLGTYALTFTGNDAGTVTTPDGTAGSFTLPGGTGATYFKEGPIGSAVEPVPSGDPPQTNNFPFLIYLGGEANDAAGMYQAVVYTNVIVTGVPNGSTVFDYFLADANAAPPALQHWAVTWTGGSTADPAAIALIPAAAPMVISGVPLGTNLGCNPASVPSSIAGLSASNACGTAAINQTDVITTNGCLVTQLFTIVATDGCGNTATAYVTNTWTADTAAPVLSGVPAGKNLGCNPTNVPTAASVQSAVTASDTCSPATVHVTGGVPSTNSCAVTQIFTVIATNACGNTATAYVTNTWTANTTPPVISGVPAGTNYGSDPASVPSSIAGLSASSACGMAAINQSSVITTNGYSMTQLFTIVATDNCGNTATAYVTNTWTTNTTPLVTWTNPAPITYGTALSSNQLNAMANVPGSFAYAPPNGAVLNTGTNILSLTFTPSNVVEYSSVTTNVSLVVLSAPLSVTAANASRPFGGTNPVFTGTITGLVNGDSSYITAQYSCSATQSSPAGIYPIVPSLVDPNDRQTNYTVSLIDGELTVGFQLAVVSSNDPALIAPLYLAGQGADLYVTGNGTNGTSAVFSLPSAGGAATNLYAAHNPQQIAILGTNLFWIAPNSGPFGDTQVFRASTNGSGSATAIYSGGLSGLIVAGSGLASDGTVLYAADEVNGSVWRLNSNGTGLTQLGPNRYSGFSSDLNTIAVSQGIIYLADSGQGTGSPQVVSIATNGSSFTTLASGAPFVNPSGIAVGTNGMIYVSDPGAGNTIWQLPVGGGTPTVLLPGTLFNSIQGLAFVNGILYVADRGADVIYAFTLFAPVNTPPVITWTNPVPITYGTPLSSTQLDPTANVSGTFAFNPPNGTVPDTGANTLTAIFTPTDTVHYIGATNSVSLVVLPAPLTVTAANTNRPDYQPNPPFSGTITGLVNGDNITATYSTTATNSSPPGTYPIMPSLVDPNNRQTNYTVTMVNGTLTVGTVLTWASPAPILYGTALGPGQLDATANVPGSFAYSPSTNTVLPVGTYTLSVTFVPTDTVDYNSATTNVSLEVSPATLVVTAANATRAYGQANPVFVDTIVGLQNGDNITATNTCAATTNSRVGAYPIVPSLVDPNNRETNYTVTLVNGTLTVTALPQTNYSEAYTFTTIAGYPGFGSADGADAQFNYPTGVAVDGAGNVYVADTDNDTIRKITPAGLASTLAGLAGNVGDSDGTGSAAQFNYPSGVAVDANTNLYVADTYNFTIRMITPAGAVSTIAGLAGYAGDSDGTNSTAQFNYPSGVAVDGAGNVYVADSGNDTIRKLTPSGSNWVVSTIAGLPGSAGATDGTGSAAQFNNPSGVAVGANPSPQFFFPSALFNNPSGVAVDANGNLYVADTGNNTIRMITPSGWNWTVSTIAGLAGNTNAVNGTGSAARFNSPYGVALDTNGNLYVGDMGNSTIRKLTLSGGNWVVSTLAGSAGSVGSLNESGTSAQFNNPAGVAVDASGYVYVADAKNALIRKITSAGAVSTLAGSTGGTGSADGPGSDARFYRPFGTAVDSFGNVFVADTDNDTIRRITSVGEVSTFAGSAQTFGSADGVGSNARFDAPAGVAVDTNDNVYVADRDNNTIRMITPEQVVSTIAGLPGSAGTANGTGSAAQFNNPSGVAVDANGNLYVADTGNNTIRMITPSGGNWTVSTIAGLAGKAGTNDGTGASAWFNSPYGVAVDGAGNLYVADSVNCTIRKITPVGTTWIVSTIAGSAGSPGSFDGMGSAARFYFPQGIAVDTAGNVYVADTGNDTIRKIEPEGTNWQVGTIGGLANGQSGSEDGTGTEARFWNPEGMAVDNAGSIYVGDTKNNTIRKGVFAQYVPVNPVPYTQPPMNGEIVVILAGVTNGQWRFPWELGWRNSGQPATNLVQGEYPIEFSTVPGYLTVPLPGPVAVTNGATMFITNQYYPTIDYADMNDGGSLTVDIQPSPPAGAGWRFLGSTNNFYPPDSSTNLVAGTYLIEFAPVTGFSTPPNLSVQVVAGEPTVLQITYLLAQSPPGGVNLPAPVPPGSISDLADYPYGFNGQLESDVGYGSGVAVQTNVVLTAAHLVFNDQTLSYVSQAYWFYQEEAGVFEPDPLPARGWYVLSGYAAQRTNDLAGGLAPDESSPQSRNLDVAALYFLSPVANGGYGGYLPSDAVPNEWLSSTANKMLVGYPVDGSQFGVANIVPGMMYETGPQRTPLALAADPVNDQQVYTATWLLSYPGNSSGPFYVQFNGYYYPAGVYLGTLYNGIVPHASAIRAIDSNVVNMIALAAALGDNGTNNSGGGVITVSVGNNINSLNPASLAVTLPQAAYLAGGAWDFVDQPDGDYSRANPSAQVVNSPGTYYVQFKQIPGWNVPANNQTVTLVAQQLVTITGLYTLAVSWNNPASITYGTALGASQLDASAITPGIYAYSPSAGTVLSAGTHTLSVTFTPNDTTDYGGASSANVSLTVLQATPILTWGNPASIIAGTPLSSSQLNATANVAGSFAYSPSINTILSAGTHALSVTFTPNDAVDYTGATRSVSLTVIASTPPVIQTAQQSGRSFTFTWSALTNQIYQIQSTANLAQPNWTSLGSVTATNPTMTVSEPMGANSQQFFRVVLLP